MLSIRAGGTTDFRFWYHGGWVSPQAAVDALINAGEAGMATLRRLHEEGAVQDMVLAARLRNLADAGYPVQRRWPPGP